MSTHEPEVETSIRFGLADDGQVVTAEEFDSAEFDEPWIYEREGGRLVVMAPDGGGHVRQSEPWRDHLGAYRLQHPEIVQAVVSQAWIRVDPDHDRIADIAVYLGGDLDQLDIPHQIPDLVFEFVSASKKDRTRDFIEKRLQYERLGIREYVIIDRFSRTVVVLSLESGHYSERSLTAADVYESPLLPGFAFPLVGVWPR